MVLQEFTYNGEDGNWLIASDRNAGIVTFRYQNNSGKFPLFWVDTCGERLIKEFCEA